MAIAKIDSFILQGSPHFGMTNSGLRAGFSRTNSGHVVAAGSEIEPFFSAKLKHFLASAGRNLGSS